MNDTTRRYPRTMQEAFGPYTRPEITEPQRPMDWQDKLVLAGSIVVGLVFALLALGVV